jgi:hypothetical protein
MKQASETLAGRVVYVELAPMDALEIARRNGDLNRTWSRGGFPESLLARSDAESLQCRRAFVRSYLERDVPMFAPRMPAETVGRLWTMLAHGQGTLLNQSVLAAGLAVSTPTVGRYVDLLVDLMLVDRRRRAYPLLLPHGRRRRGGPPLRASWQSRDDHRDQTLDRTRGFERLSLGASDPQAKAELSPARRHRHLAGGQEHHGDRPSRSDGAAAVRLAARGERSSRSRCQQVRREPGSVRGQSSSKRRTWAGATCFRSYPAVPREAENGRPREEAVTGRLLDPSHRTPKTTMPRRCRPAVRMLQTQSAKRRTT